MEAVPEGLRRLCVLQRDAEKMGTKRKREEARKEGDMGKLKRARYVPNHSASRTGLEMVEGGRSDSNGVAGLSSLAMGATMDLDPDTDGRDIPIEVEPDSPDGNTPTTGGGLRARGSGSGGGGGGTREMEELRGRNIDEDVLDPEVVGRAVRNSNSTGTPASGHRNGGTGGNGNGAVGASEERERMGEGKWRDGDRIDMFVRREHQDFDS
ncbi:hypothetical protein BT69DRAFT_1279803 [Atractiella rhizophila]|nr:hypothetical protein BT69DRAFT_1279803 [Atractiella rhizophila]